MFSLLHCRRSVRGGLWRTVCAATWLVAALLAGANPAIADEPAVPTPSEPASSAPAVVADAYSREEWDETDREHWAFVPIQRPELPEVKRGDWVRNPIDAFILAGLEDAKLAPTPEADRETLLRRVTLDLVGLPPTLAERAEFLADTSPDAYEKLVDRLLARAEYGERWARHWFDVVRYAESNGYERDGAKPHAWRYRDYVIDAMNRDKPYDQFLIEQLAGDELTDTDAEKQIATTFLRLGAWDDEPADPLQDRYDQLDDVVGTVTAAFMAQTIRCARCHDHKFESFSQKDYTRVLANFEPLKRPQDGRTDLDRLVGTPAEVAAYEETVARVDRRSAEIRARLDVLDREGLERFIAAGRLTPPGGAARLVETSQAAPQAWRYVLTDPGPDWQTPDFADALWTEAPGGFGAVGTPGAVVRTAWNTSGIWLRRTVHLPDSFALPSDLEALRLVVHHDEEVEIYLNGVLAAKAAGYTVDYETLPVSAEAAATLRPGPNVVAVRCTQTAGGQYIDVGLEFARRDVATVDGATPLGEIDVPSLAALRIEPAMRNDEQRNLARTLAEKHRAVLAAEESETIHAERQQLTSELDSLKGQRPPEPPRAYVWREEGPVAPLTKVLKRGDPRTPGDEVGPGVPSILVEAPLPPPTPTVRSTGRRLRLARWLADPANPLTARVFVNRIWQHHFGDGIVGTENDFGVMGEAPTHPELLDWLAAEFMAGGWKIKQLHRLIVLSSTYRQGSAPNARAERVDSGNDLLWHMPPQRLEVEAFRDAVLSVSGQLNPERGGPSVFPMIPPEVLASQSRPGDGWKPSDPRAAARRSVYVFVKRTLRPPEFDVMDFPDTNGTCEQRVVSTTAPQALSLSNGSFVRDGARQLAARLTAEADEVARRIELAFLLCFARSPSAMELRSVQGFLEQQRAQIARDRAAEPADAEAAAWESLCLVLLNSNEFAYAP